MRNIRVDLQIEQDIFISLYRHSIWLRCAFAFMGFRRCRKYKLSNSALIIWLFSKPQDIFKTGETDGTKTNKRGWNWQLWRRLYLRRLAQDPQILWHDHVVGLYEQKHLPSKIKIKCLRSVVRMSTVNSQEKEVLNFYRLWYANSLFFQ